MKWFWRLILITGCLTTFPVNIKLLVKFFILIRSSQSVQRGNFSSVFHQNSSNRRYFQNARKSFSFALFFSASNFAQRKSIFRDDLEIFNRFVARCASNLDDRSSLKIYIENKIRRQLKSLRGTPFVRSIRLIDSRFDEISARIENIAAFSFNRRSISSSIDLDFQANISFNFAVRIDFQREFRLNELLSLFFSKFCQTIFFVTVMSGNLVVFLEDFVLDVSTLELLNSAEKYQIQWIRYSSMF